MAAAVWYFVSVVIYPLLIIYNVLIECFKVIKLLAMIFIWVVNNLNMVLVVLGRLFMFQYWFLLMLLSLGWLWSRLLFLLRATLVARIGIVPKLTRVDLLWMQVWSDAVFNMLKPSTLGLNSCHLATWVISRSKGVWNNGTRTWACKLRWESMDISVTYLVVLHLYDFIMIKVSRTHWFLRCLALRSLWISL